MADVLSSLLGALVGGLLSLLGVYWANIQAERKAAADRWHSIRGLLRGVRAELDLTWAHWMRVKGDEISRSRDPVLFQLRLEENFFIVFEANADKLGNIPDDRLLVLLVEVHTKYKVFNQTLRMYSGAVGELSDAARRGPATVQPTVEYLSNCWAQLKQEQETLDRLITELVARIDRILESTRAGLDPGPVTR